MTALSVLDAVVAAHRLRGLPSAVCRFACQDGDQRDRFLAAETASRRASSAR